MESCCHGRRDQLRASGPARGSASCLPGAVAEPRGAAHVVYSARVPTTMSATLMPALLVSTCLRSVVLPAPKNPLSTVTGRRVLTSEAMAAMVVSGRELLELSRRVVDLGTAIAAVMVRDAGPEESYGVSSGPV